MLRDKKHGKSRLDFDGEILSYGGTGSLSNNVLLRFISNRYRKLFITYDLDSESHVEKYLKALEFKKKRDYLPIGIDAAGQRNIEGLLPESVHNEIYSNNTDLVRQATQGTSEEKKSAKNQIKRLMLEKFQSTADFDAGDFDRFSKIVPIINKALK